MSKEYNHNYMLIAIKKAEENFLSRSGGPFGAVIVRDGEIIAVAGNCVTSNNDPTAHAEVVAIREACKALETFDLSGCESLPVANHVPCVLELFYGRVSADCTMQPTGTMLHGQGLMMNYFIGNFPYQMTNAY